MSLCRYLPTPSDRMAVMWTLLNIKDAVVLEYGPAGTTHYCVSLFGMMGISPDQNLFTTHMSEDDVVMGDVTRLEQAILEIDQSYSPKAIFVVASAVTAVIGTDLTGVCNYMQDQVKTRLIPMVNGGFRGDYSVGLRQVYEKLVQEFTLPTQEKQEKHYNVLGASAGAYRIQSDLWELEDLMQRSFGFTRHTALGLDCTLAELEVMPSAKLNLVLRPEALTAAQKMEAEYGIPYVYGAPYGYSGTRKWLEKIAEALKLEIDPSVQQQLRQCERETMMYRMYASMYRQKEHPASAAIIGDYEMVHGMTEMCKDLDFIPTLQICSHTLKDVEQPDQDIIHCTTEKEQIDKIKALNYHLVLGDDVSLFVSGETNTGLCVSFPLVGHVQTARHLPLMGIRGMDYILETVDRYYQVLE